MLPALERLPLPIVLLFSVTVDRVLLGGASLKGRGDPVPLFRMSCRAHVGARGSITRKTLHLIKNERGREETPLKPDARLPIQHVGAIGTAG